MIHRFVPFRVLEMNRIAFQSQLQLRVKRKLGGRVIQHLLFLSITVLDIWALRGRGTVLCISLHRTFGIVTRIELLTIKYRQIE